MIVKHKNRISYIVSINILFCYFVGEKYFIMKYAYLLFIFTLLTSCYQVERNCADFKDGTFEYTYQVNEKTITSKFTRKGNLEIDYNGKHVDSINVRWINDCEYILSTINPKTLSQKKAIHIKILTTTKNTYNFESKIINDPQKRISTGTVTKTNL